jgi:hypothetical protein
MRYSAVVVVLAIHLLWRKDAIRGDYEKVSSAAEGTERSPVEAAGSNSAVARMGPAGSGYWREAMLTV